MPQTMATMIEKYFHTKDRISYCATSRHTAAPTANGSSACLSCDSLVFVLDLLQSAFDKQFIAIHQRQASMRSGIDRFSPDDMIGVDQDLFAIVSFSLHQHWVFLCNRGSSGNAPPTTLPLY